MSQNPHGSYGSQEPQNPYQADPQDFQAQKESTEQPASTYTSSQDASYGQQPSHQQPYTSSYSAYNNPYNSPILSSAPRPHVGLGGAFSRWRKNLFHFSGRASRSEFWWIYGIYLVVTGIAAGIFFAWYLTVVTKLLGVQEQYQDSAMTAADTQKYEDYMAHAVGQIFLIMALLGIFCFVLSLFILSVWWRRLQDAGFHGALTLLSFVGLQIIPFILAFFPSSPNGYKYDKQVDYDRR